MVYIVPFRIILFDLSQEVETCTLDPQENKVDSTSLAATVYNVAQLSQVWRHFAGQVECSSEDDGRVGVLGCALLSQFDSTSNATSRTAGPIATQTYGSAKSINPFST